MQRQVRIAGACGDTRGLPLASAARLSARFPTAECVVFSGVDSAEHLLHLGTRLSQLPRGAWAAVRRVRLEGSEISRRLTEQLPRVCGRLESVEIHYTGRDGLARLARALAPVAPLVTSLAVAAPACAKGDAAEVEAALSQLTALRSLAWGDPHDPAPAYADDLSPYAALRALAGAARSMAALESVRAAANDPLMLLAAGGGALQTLEVSVVWGEDPLLPKLSTLPRLERLTTLGLKPDWDETLDTGVLAAIAAACPSLEFLAATGWDFAVDLSDAGDWDTPAITMPALRTLKLHTLHDVPLAPGVLSRVAPRLRALSVPLARRDDVITDLLRGHTALETLEYDWRELGHGCKLEEPEELDLPQHFAALQLSLDAPPTVRTLVFRPPTFEDCLVVDEEQVAVEVAHLARAARTYWRAFEDLTLCLPFTLPTLLRQGLSGLAQARVLCLEGWQWPRDPRQWALRSVGSGAVPLYPNLQLLCIDCTHFGPAFHPMGRKRLELLLEHVWAYFSSRSFLTLEVRLKKAEQDKSGNTVFMRLKSRYPNTRFTFV